jgi:hypothetical protein
VHERVEAGSGRPDGDEGDGGLGIAVHQHVPQMIGQQSAAIWIVSQIVSPVHQEGDETRGRLGAGPRDDLPEPDHQPVSGEYLDPPAHGRSAINTIRRA